MGSLQLEKMAGKEISPGVILIEEPVPVPGTDKLRALASVHGYLAVVQLKLKFQEESEKP